MTTTTTTTTTVVVVVMMVMVMTTTPTTVSVATCLSRVRSSTPNQKTRIAFRNHVFVKTSQIINMFILLPFVLITVIQLSGRSKWASGLRPLACWDCGFESHRGHGYLSGVCCVLSGRGLCDELITRWAESYRLWCVVVCDLETSWMGRPWPTGGAVTPKTKYLTDIRFNSLFNPPLCYHLSVRSKYSPLNFVLNSVLPLRLDYKLGAHVKWRTYICRFYTLSNP